EVRERAQRESAGAREVAERGDADHDRDEDHWAGDRLDQLDEGFGQPLRLLSRPWSRDPDDDAEGDRDDHPEPQLFEDSSLSHIRRGTQTLQFSCVRWQAKPYSRRP